MVSVAHNYSANGALATLILGSDSKVMTCLLMNQA